MQSASESLSDSQRACLRLVACGRSSKEIAREVGLSPQTVDTYIKLAVAKLGAKNRREAARVLALWEASQKIGSLSPAVAEPAATTDGVGAVERRGILNLIMPPPVGGTRNELGAAAKSVEALKVAALGATAVIALALLIAGVLHTFH